MDVDAEPGVAAAARARLELKQPTLKRDGVVASDGAVVLEAADAVKVGRRELPGRFGVHWRLREARIIPWEKAIEHTLGLGQGAGLGKAQFRDEAILERTEESLHATFALWAGRRDPADTELLEGPAQLGRRDRASQLVLERQRGPGITMKEAVAIGVHRDGDTITLNEAAEQQEVAMRVLLLAKDRGEDFARGVIDGGVQDQPRATVLEPGVMAAVHLDEEAGLGHTFAPSAMAWGTAGSGAADAGRA
jgi:hypothetical protein